MRGDGSFPARTRDIRLGENIRFDAWLFSMLMDNNLAFGINADIVASPERLAFMVHREDGQVYLPCSDATFGLLADRSRSRELQAQYNRAWRIIVRLVRFMVHDRRERKRLFHFCSYRFLQYVKRESLIPSRLVKRMTDLVLAQCDCLGDPWRERRRASTAFQAKMLAQPPIRDNLDAMPQERLPASIEETRHYLDFLELIRLLCLSVMTKAWDQRPPTKEEVRELMRQAEQAAAPLRDYFTSAGRRRSTILFLCDADGGILFDLVMIHSLIRMGHRVICAVKEGFHFFAPTFDDMVNDPVLEGWLRGAICLRDKQLGKNDLLRHLREHRLVIISDGTRERINLYRVSTTFSRAWKEADVILCKGWRAADVLLGTSHEFTRDIVCCWHDGRKIRIVLRRHAADARKFSEADITAHADGIIKSMREAHHAGSSIMFYSCVIGSIPGQTSTAIALARAFVDNLRKKMDNVFIINPAEHFVEGMDGDDLMFMWERVQRSGLIDIWRFQTVEDIEESFSLLGRKVPPAWTGKDATYSTGCTKEMRIALDVQSKNREMQIIGPDPRRFFRRGEYGVGQYFDASITRPGR